MNDFILNGKASGNVAARLMQANMDPNALRPWIDPKTGNSYITVNDGTFKADGTPNHKNVLVDNTTATLRYEDWRLLDSVIVKAAKPRLRIVADLRGSGLTYNLPNGMAHTVLSTETQSDITGATISMDGVRKSQGDRPIFEISHLPLPIIHKDFSFSVRQIMASRNGGSPLDTTTAELAGRRVAELAEQLLVGSTTFGTFGGGTIYGLTTHPNRLTKTLTAPTLTAWTPVICLNEVLSMRQKSMDAFHYGPWVLYNAPAWDQYLDNDYNKTAAQGGNITLRDRIRAIQGIQDVRTADYLSGFAMILVQQTSDVIREVVGMDISTVQWASGDGMEINFKVMAILVPQIRADQNGNTGIVHGS